MGVALDNRLSRFGTLAGLLTGLLLLASCASQGTDLPDFPHYKPADAFLEMQRRAQGNRAEPPDPYAYSDFNRSIYQGLQEQKRLSQQEVEWRARQREEMMRRARASSQGEWNALQQRLSRDQAMNALRDRELADSSASFRLRSEARYRGYQQRLERLALEQEA